jgi:hypothetical protein
MLVMTLLMTMVAMVAMVMITMVVMTLTPEMTTVTVVMKQMTKATMPVTMLVAGPCACLFLMSQLAWFRSLWVVWPSTIPTVPKHDLSDLAEQLELEQQHHQQQWWWWQWCLCYQKKNYWHCYWRWQLPLLLTAAANRTAVLCRKS